MLRRIFGPNREEITEDWRKLHNEDLSVSYCSPNTFRVIILRIRREGHVGRMGERRGVCRVLVQKHEGKRPLGRPRQKWKDNIKIELQEMGCGSMDWNDVAQDRDRWGALVSTVMNFRVP